MKTLKNIKQATEKKRKKETLAQHTYAYAYLYNPNKWTEFD